MPNVQSSYVSTAQGETGSLLLSAESFSGALGAILMITVSDSDLQGPSANMPLVTAVRSAGGVSVSVPLYQRIGGDWIGFIRTVTLTYLDEDSNLLFDDLNPTIVVDNDDDGSFSSGDLVLSGRTPGIGNTLTEISVPPLDPLGVLPGSTKAGGKFVDSNGDGTYTNGEALYLDADGSGTVTVGDKRLVNIGIFLAGSIVRGPTAYGSADPDVGTRLTRFNLESRPSNAPPQDETTPVSGHLNFPPYNREPNLAVIDVGTIVTTVPSVKLGDSITVTYHDAQPQTKISKTATRTQTTAGLSLDRTAYPPQATVRLTLRDSDLDLDPTSPDTLKPNTRLTATIENRTVAVGALIETGIHSGVFEGKFALGEIALGASIRVSYSDAQDLGSTLLLTSEAKVETSTGALTIERDVYLPNERIKIAVVDSDLNLDSQLSEVIPQSSELVTVKLETEETHLPITLTETEASSAIFTGSFLLNSSRFALVAGDAVSIRYEDQTDSNGLRAIVEKNLRIEGTLRFPANTSLVKTLNANGDAKSNFSPGETMFPSTKVRNTLTSTSSYLVAIQVSAPDDTILLPAFMQVRLDAGEEFEFTPNVNLPPDAKPGTWQLEVNVFDKFPLEGGKARAKPAIATFQVE